MIYFKNENGDVFAYETQEERDQYGAPDLLLMTEAEVASHLTPAAASPQVPASVTMRQARLALYAAGLLSQVEAAIEALPEPNRTVARIEWDYASEVHRASEFVTLLGAELELDKQSLDDLFLKAREL